MMLRQGWRNEHGFTLIEVAVAAAVLLTGLLGAISTIDTSNTINVTTKAREQGVALARELIESGRSIPYAQLNANTIVSQVQAMPGLGNANAGSGWTIQRRGVTYTVAMGTCKMDDPANGYGQEDPNLFCAATTGSQTSAATCSQLLSLGIAGNPTLLGQLTGSLSGQVSVGQCGLDVNLTGQISDLTQAQLSLCLLGSCQQQPYSTNNKADDYARIYATVTWKVNGTWQNVLLSTTEANPGQAAGPGVQSITVTNPLPILSALLGTVTFQATTDQNAVALRWAVNGAPQGSATNLGGGHWTWTWGIGDATLRLGTETLDGNYTISAFAYDSSGNQGPQLSKTVVLARSKPYAPKNFVGGHDASVVDFLWAPNKEGDILGYRVYRVGGLLQPNVLVCSTSNVHATSCQDTSPPISASIQYFVVATDQDNGTVQEDDHSSTLTVTTLNQAPNPPRNLAASTNSGNTILAWTAPSPADNDGDQISFYRIYRDGQAIANRYDTAPGSATSYTDTQTGGVAHSYWVTAVDPQLAESTAAGPVTK